MARIPSSRNAVHRRLRISDLRAGNDSPLGTLSRLAVLATCRSRRLSTQRSRRCGLSDMSLTQSLPCAGVSPQLSPNACRDVLVAADQNSSAVRPDAVRNIRLAMTSAGMTEYVAPQSDQETL